MSKVLSTFNKDFANGISMFDNCSSISSIQNCYSVHSNIATIKDVEESQKKINDLELGLNKMQEEINEKLSWQTICLYLTWAMIIVIGFMICFKSFDVSIEVNNPVQNQEVILKQQ